MKYSADAANARQEIQDLTYRLAHYSDTGKTDKISDLFADDGVFDETAVGLPLSTGRAEIASFFQGAAGGLQFSAHFVTGHFLTELSETQAKSVCNLLFECGLPNGVCVKVIGYMEDSFTRVDGKWLFQSHKLNTFVPPAMSGPSDA